MKAECVVVDTNVLISAAFRTEGAPCDFVDTVRSENGLLLSSDATLDELRSRLHVPSFDRSESFLSVAVFDCFERFFGQGRVDLIDMLGFGDHLFCDEV